jgi:hypothetical protein
VNIVVDFALDFDRFTVVAFVTVLA